MPLVTMHYTGGRTIAQFATYVGRRHHRALRWLRPPGDPLTAEDAWAACDGNLGWKRAIVGYDRLYADLVGTRVSRS
jgi:hypothetical protein